MYFNLMSVKEWTISGALFLNEIFGNRFPHCQSQLIIKPVLYVLSKSERNSCWHAKNENSWLQNKIMEQNYVQK